MTAAAIEAEGSRKSTSQRQKGQRETKENKTSWPQTAQRMWRRHEHFDISCTPSHDLGAGSLLPQPGAVTRHHNYTNCGNSTVTHRSLKCIEPSEALTSKVQMIATPSTVLLLLLPVSVKYDRHDQQRPQKHQRAVASILLMADSSSCQLTHVCRGRDLSVFGARICRFYYCCCCCCCCC